MIETFLEQTPADMMELKKALEYGDYPTIALISHKLKTSVGFVGLSPVLENTLAAMELEGSTNADLENIKYKMVKVEEVINIAFEELQLDLAKL